MDKFSKEVYDPSSPQYHQFLTAEQFKESYAPSEKDYQAVMDYVKSKGLTVVDTVSNRIGMAVSGKVKDVERALHIQLYNYRRPNGSVFYAPDREPSIDIHVPVLHIGGLDDAIIPVPASH